MPRRCQLRNDFPRLFLSCSALLVWFKSVKIQPLLTKKPPGLMCVIYGHEPACVLKASFDPGHGTMSASAGPEGASRHM